MSVKDFRDTGLLMFINQILHVFGWVICAVGEGDDMYLVPARTNFRGFTQSSIDSNYEKVARWIRDNGKEIYDEAGWNGKG